MAFASARRVDRCTFRAFCACLVSLAGFWAAQRAAHVTLLDLMVYRAEGRTVLDGADLYAMRATEADLAATYPPLAALLFTPLTLPGVTELRILATAGNLALLVALVHLSLRLTDRHSPARTFWVSAIAVWCEPVWTTLRYGQINLLLAVAVLWDLTRRRGHRWAGAATGVAAAIKLTPGLFILFSLVTGLLLTRRGLTDACGRDIWPRFAAVASATFAGATTAAALVLPRDSHRYWTEMIFMTGRVGYAEETANQSLRGVLARLLHTADPGFWWSATAAVASVAGLAVAVRAALRGDRAGATVACALTALLVSPVSWSHHWVWCVPVLVVVATRFGPGWTICTGLVFSSYSLWWVPHGPDRPELLLGAGEMTLSALYVATAAAVLVKVERQAVVGNKARQAVANE